MSLLQSVQNLFRPSFEVDQPAHGAIPPYLNDAILNYAIRTGDKALEQSQLATLQAGQQVAAQNLSGYEQGKDPKVQERFLYTAEQKETLPGRTLWREGEDMSKPADPDVPFVAKILGDHIAFQDRYKITWAQAGDLHNTYHYGFHYNNAFFDGTGMVDGDGDGRFLKDLHKDGDVTHHEVGHGDTQYEAGAAMKRMLKAKMLAGDSNIKRRVVIDTKTLRPVEQMLAGGKIYGGLDYDHDPGAINESYSDVEAFVIRNRGKKVIDLTYDDKLLGAICFVAPNNVEGSPIKGKHGAIRNFDKLPAYDNKDLGRDPQPAHFKDKYTGGGDSGGVHYNSKICSNLPFLLAGQYLAKIDPNATFDELERVWMDTRRVMHTRESFKEAIQDYIAVAKKLYPGRPEIAKAIEQAFTDIGGINQGIVGDAYNYTYSQIVWLPTWVGNTVKSAVSGLKGLLNGGRVVRKGSAPDAGAGSGYQH